MTAPAQLSTTLNRSSGRLQRRCLALCLLSVLGMQGCATKTYGRQPLVTTYERENMSCREIDLDIAKTQGFIDKVNQESKFSIRDVYAFFGDLTIGNHMEEHQALESANQRIQDFRQLSEAKHCPAAPPNQGAGKQNLDSAGLTRP